MGPKLRNFTLYKGQLWEYFTFPRAITPIEYNIFKTSRAGFRSEFHVLTVKLGEKNIFKKMSAGGGFEIQKFHVIYWQLWDFLLFPREITPSRYKHFETSRAVFSSTFHFLTGKSSEKTLPTKMSTEDGSKTQTFRVI